MCVCGGLIKFMCELRTIATTRTTIAGQPIKLGMAVRGMREGEGFVPSTYYNRDASPF